MCQESTQRTRKSGSLPVGTVAAFLSLSCNPGEISRMTVVLQKRIRMNFSWGPSWTSVLAILKGLAKHSWGAVGQAWE